jgi:hypothetical protein
MARARRTNHSHRGSNGGARSFSIGSHWRSDGVPKAAYASQRAALSVADVQRAESGVDLKAYQCDFCSSWHLATASGRGR